MRMKRIYIDLDGVLADFDYFFPTLFGVNHKDLLDEDMWKYILDHPSYFRDMPMCKGAKDFYEEIKYLNPIVLTACPKSAYQKTAVQKVEWSREHLSPDITVLPVMGAKNKWLFMHKKGDILIDDQKRNIDDWNNAGGIGILHYDFYTTYAELLNML